MLSGKKKLILGSILKWFLFLTRIQLYLNTIRPDPEITKVSLWKCLLTVQSKKKKKGNAGYISHGYEERVTNKTGVSSSLELICFITIRKDLSTSVVFPAKMTHCRVLARAPHIGH